MSYCTWTLRPMRIAIFRFTKVVHPNVPSLPKRILHPLTDLPLPLPHHRGSHIPTHVPHPSHQAHPPPAYCPNPTLTHHRGSYPYNMPIPFHLTCFRPIPLADHRCGSMTTLRPMYPNRHHHPKQSSHPWERAFLKLTHLASEHRTNNPPQTNLFVYLIPVS